MVVRAGALTGLMNQPTSQIIDASLKFDQSKKTYLKRTPGSAGNRRTWTYSAWIKRGDFPSAERGLFSTFGSVSNFNIYLKNTIKNGKNSSDYSEDTQAENYSSLSLKSSKT